MASTILYKQIADEVRQEILGQALSPGDRLPSVREMADRWQCTIGTVQRAYDLLAADGLLVVRPGQGTHVADVPPLAQAESLRRAKLIHRAESFLLEVLTAGYTQAEVEQAVQLALERWRTVNHNPPPWPAQTLRFVGSHDPAVALITTHFGDVAPDFVLQLQFAGSLGGLIALAEGQAELAGIHLWDETTDSYNAPFVTRLLPGREVVLLTLAHRRLGLVTAPGNPLNIAGLPDLAQPGLRFVNRQRGAGTRVWLDAQLRRAGVSVAQINGYTTEAKTHSQVAQAVAEDRADAGLAVESAAMTWGLHFVPLTMEQYELAITAEVFQRPPVQALAGWLASGPARQAIAALGGYETGATGQVRRVG
ncbi:MAG: hypothetical protein Kow0031_30480 [Anaerolineae bacterium]